MDTNLTNIDGIGPRLAAKRRYLGLHQSAVAEALGLSVRTIRRIEAGANTTVKNIIAYVHWLERKEAEARSAAVWEPISGMTGE